MMGMNSRTGRSRNQRRVLGLYTNSDSPPKMRDHSHRARNLRMSENGNERRTGPAYTAGPSAMKHEILFPMSGRMPLESARNTEKGCDQRSVSPGAGGEAH